MVFTQVQQKNVSKIYSTTMYLELYSLETVLWPVDTWLNKTYLFPKVASSVGQRITVQTNIYNVTWPGAS